jgi:hypothetical protein
MTPEASVLRRKISPYRPSETTPFLNAGTAALVDADQRAPGLDGEVDDLDDLLAVHLAQRAAEDGDVLAEDADGRPWMAPVPVMTPSP